MWRIQLPHMIASYNRKQLLLAVLAALGSLICYGLAFGFFMGAFLLAAAALELPHLNDHAPWFATVVVVVITISGYRTWKSRGGYYRYDQSGMYHRTAQGRVAMIDLAGVDPNQVTGWAYLLGQVFLSGPLLALRAMANVRNRIPLEHGLENRLQAVLERLQSADKWQGEAEYREELREILLLARMRKIDFSAAKGTARFRALKAASVEAA